jgi:hypothetical protein
MQLLAFREYPAIDAQTLVEFRGHERLFRGADGSFLLHMSSEGQPVVEERTIWLSARDAISWLNEEPDHDGSLWEFADVVPAVNVASQGALMII